MYYHHIAQSYSVKMCAYYMLFPAHIFELNNCGGDEIREREQHWERRDRYVASSHIQPGCAWLSYASLTFLAFSGTERLGWENGRGEEFSVWLPYLEDKAPHSASSVNTNRVSVCLRLCVSKSEHACSCTQYACMLVCVRVLVCVHGEAGQILNILSGNIDISTDKLYGQ